MLLLAIMLLIGLQVWIRWSTSRDKLVLLGSIQQACIQTQFSFYDWSLGNGAILC